MSHLSCLDWRFLRSCGCEIRWRSARETYTDSSHPPISERRSRFWFTVVNFGFTIIDFEFIIVNFGFIIVDFLFAILDFGLVVICLELAVICPGFVVICLKFTVICFEFTVICLEFTVVDLGFAVIGLDEPNQRANRGRPAEEIISERRCYCRRYCWWLGVFGCD